MNLFLSSNFLLNQNISIQFFFQFVDQLAQEANITQLVVNEVSNNEMKE